MGLASKLASANSGAAPAPAGNRPGAPPAQQQGQYSSGPPAYSSQAQQPQQGQGQYAPPGGQGQSSSGYGQPPPQAQQQYGQQGGQQGGQYGQQGQQGQAQGQQGQNQQGGYGGQQNNQYGQPTTQGGQQQGQYGAPQQQQGQHGGQQGQGGQQGSNQYGQQPQGQNQYGQPQQNQQGGQYGQQQQPQQGQQQQYGQQQQPQQAQGGAGSISADVILNVLRQGVADQNIGAFYPQGSLEQIAQSVSRSGALQRIAAEWKLPMEIAMDLVKLSLFDTILYVDDSGSMTFEEGGTRIDDLKLIAARVAFAAALFDQDGIQVRFMNSNLEGNNIASEQAALALIQQVKFSGLTPLGTSLDKKILQPLVLGPARAGRLPKPVLVIAITDGIPGGENRHTIVNVIENANKELSRTRYGSDAISFQLAQVGNDQAARAFLEEIDKHPVIGGLVDTTSNYENEAEDMARANPPVDLTVDLWLVKMMLGGIDSSYDSKDE